MRFPSIGGDLTRGSRHRRAAGVPARRRGRCRVLAAAGISCGMLALGHAGAEGVAPAPAPAAAPAPADPAPGPGLAGSFSGTAAADGVRVGLAIPSFLIIENFVDGGGPTAQASLDSLG